MNVLLVAVAPHHADVIRCALRREWFAPSVSTVRTGEEAACVSLQLEPDLVVVGTLLSDMTLADLREMLDDFGYDGRIGAIVHDVNEPRPVFDFVLADGFGSRVSRRVFRRAPESLRRAA